MAYAAPVESSDDREPPYGPVERRRGDRRGRPRKTAADKLCPVSSSVEPPVYRILQRIAVDRGLSMADVVRRVLSGRLGAYDETR